MIKLAQVLALLTLTWGKPPIVNRQNLMDSDLICNVINDTYRHKGLRKKLVELLASKGISDEAVLHAIDAIPRHLFMDNAFVNFAYKDQAFPIGADQTIRSLTP